MSNIILVDSDDEELVLEEEDDTEEIFEGMKGTLTVGKLSINYTISLEDKLNPRYNLPTLYCKDKKERIGQWNIYVSNDKIWRTSGIMGGEYKVREFPPIVVKPKNIGKTNETSLFEQAMFEAQSKWNKQLDKGYMEYESDLSAPGRNILPMLANKYTERGEKYLKIPFAVSRKLDGVRCIAHKEGDEIRLISRLGKDFNFMDDVRSSVKQLLSNAFGSHILDGEIYNHDVPFNVISGTARKKKTRSKDDHKMLYYVFDIIDEGLSYKERSDILNEMKEKNKNIENSKIRFEIYETVYSHDDVEDFHTKYVSEGYEGIILRNFDSFYTPKFRSNGLLKYKHFDDAEFKIIGGKEGTVTEIGTVVYRCITEGGKEFDVRPRGTMDRRRELFKNLDKYIGKMLTVRYQGLDPKSLCPRFPVGLILRDYE